MYGVCILLFLIGKTNQTLTNMQLVQNCIGQNINKRSVIIDTDIDVDDLWAILYLLNVNKFKNIIYCLICYYCCN
jgi:hypothetical protein